MEIAARFLTIPTQNELAGIVATCMDQGIRQDLVDAFEQKHSYWYKTPLVGSKLPDFDHTTSQLVRAMELFNEKRYPELVGYMNKQLLSRYKLIYKDIIVFQNHLTQSIQPEHNLSEMSIEEILFDFAENSRIDPYKRMAALIKDNRYEVNSFAALISENQNPDYSLSAQRIKMLMDENLSLNRIVADLRGKLDESSIKAHKLEKSNDSLASFLGRKSEDAIDSLIGYYTEITSILKELGYSSTNWIFDVSPDKLERMYSECKPYIGLQNENLALAELARLRKHQLDISLEADNFIPILKSLLRVYQDKRFYVIDPGGDEDKWTFLLQQLCNSPKVEVSTERASASYRQADICILNKPNIHFEIPRQYYTTIPTIIDGMLVIPIIHERINRNIYTEAFVQLVEQREKLNGKN
jgi:hypothetical protein